MVSCVAATECEWGAWRWQYQNVGFLYGVSEHARWTWSSEPAMHGLHPEDNAWAAVVSGLQKTDYATERCA